MCTICDKTATAPVDIDDVCDVAFNRAVEVSTVPIAALPALTETTAMGATLTNGRTRVLVDDETNGRDGHAGVVVSAGVTRATVKFPTKRDGRRTAIIARTSLLVIG